MHPGEHELMAQVEERHWWYQGLRDAIERTLAQPALRLPPRPRVLDAGCGTGENLRMLQRVLVPGYLGGFDASPEAVDWARRKAPGADVYPGDVCDPELHQEQLDLIVSLDVIYIPGVERSRSGLERMVSALSPGGLLLLNLPAYRWLYSEHDVAIHTTERYTAAEVRALLGGLGLEVARLTYRLCLLFPLVVASRLPSMLRARPGDPAARSDLHSPPSAPLNRLLASVVRWENRGIARGWRFPWGSSVFAVGRKR